MTATLDAVAARKKDKPQPTAEQELAEELVALLHIGDWSWPSSLASMARWCQRCACSSCARIPRWATS
jgi:hypothetical protein